MLYGALDNDDMFMYMGGLASAIRSIDGKSPELVVTNTRDPGHPEMTSMDKFIGTEFRSRYVNPTWIEGMKKEGYAGAGAMREFVEYLWGWNATVPELVDAGMWQETFDVYVNDKRELGLEEFFEKNSPFAYQDMAGRMVETIRKGYWKADAETTKRLVSEYVESVNAHGTSGAEFTTGNPRLTAFVLERGKAAGIPAPALDQFRQTLEKAMGGSVTTATRTAEAFVTKNETAVPAPSGAPRSATMPAGTQTHVPQPSSPVAAISGAAPSQGLKGFLMEEQQKSRATMPSPRPTSDPSVGWRTDLFVSVPVLALLVAWRFRRRQQ